MNMKENRFRLILPLYSVATIGANIMAVVFSSFVRFPTGAEESNADWLNYLDTNETFTNIIMISSFLVPCVLELFYIMPSLKKNLNENLISKRIVNAPTFLGAIGVIGWITAFLSQIFVVFLAKQTYPEIPAKPILATSGLYTALESVLSFIISYFMLEVLNRSFILPKLFPKGNISQTPGIIKPSTLASFVLYFIAVSVFPVSIAVGAYCTLQMISGIKENSIIYVLIGMLAVDFVLTVVFSRMFSIPMKQLKRASEHIAAGDYTKRVDVISNDEMGVLSDAFNNISKSLIEKDFMRDTFGKIVDPKVRDFLMKGNVSLGGELLFVTVLFCDIRGFTSMSEKMMPEKVVYLINRYFDAMGTCITNHHGVINKYIGDAIMAMYGAPVTNNTHASDALASALDMRKSLVQLNESLAKEGFPALRFGIGIHTGEVLAGNIGASSRMEYTVMGDTVNTASRLESLCKEYNCDLLFSEATFCEVEKESDGGIRAMTGGGRYLDDVHIRGRESTLKIYTV